MKKILSISLFLFLALIIALILAIPVSNNYAAKETAKYIAEITLPQQTEYIESAHLAGKLVGNGNGMQYFGAILLKSKLSVNELEEYYKKFTNNDYKIYVKRAETGVISEIEHGYLSFETNITGDDYYIVFTWGENTGFLSELENFDLRAH